MVLKFSKWKFLLFFLSIGLWANSYIVDNAHTKVGFEITHMMISNVDGRFNDYEAIFEYDENTNTLKSVSAKIKVESIDTANKKRDDHLRSEDFFDAKKYPFIEFVNTEAIKIKAGETKKLKGKLTIKGITKEVVMDVKYIAKIKDFMGKERIGFTAETKINRKDFGITWNKILETGGLVIGEEVFIQIKGEGIKN